MMKMTESGQFRAIALTLLVAAGSYAQTAPTPKRSMEARLTILNPIVCLGSDLKLRMDVTNITNEPIELNRQYFWNMYAIYPSSERDKLSEGEEFVLNHFQPRSTSEDIGILAAGESYVSHRYFSLKDTNEGPGMYNIDIATYRNSVRRQFQVKDCATGGEQQS